MRRIGLVNRNARCALTASAVVLSALAVTGCQSGSSTNGEAAKVKRNPTEYFAESIFGVKASPRVTDSLVVPKGGGRDQTGKPYKVRGKWYYPKEQPGYVKVGKASWYGSSFHGRLTANGEVYDMNHLSAAHPTFPLPSYARVTNVKTGTSVMVRVNDRGPYSDGRVLDLSSKAADFLDIKREGTGDVKIEYVGRAPLEGDDTAMLMASYRPANNARPIDDGLASGVMIASNEPVVDRRLAFAVAMTRSDAVLPGVRAMMPAPVIAMNASQRTPATAARKATGAAETDGMNIGSIIQNSRDVAPASSVSEAVPAAPIPTFRAVIASYAASPARTGAANALQSVAAGSSGERIEIGLLDDEAVIAAIGRVVSGHGRLDIERGPDEGSSARPSALDLSVTAHPGEDADALLAAIWRAGGRDAFVLRD